MKICSTNQYYNGTGCSRCLNGTISAEGSVGSTSCRVSNVDSAAVGLIIGLAVGIPLLLILCCFCGCFAAGYFSKSSTRGQVQPQNNGPYQQLAPQNGQPQMYQQPPQNVYQPPQHYGQPGYMQGPPPPPQNYGQPVVYQQPYQSAYNSGQPQGYYQPAYPPPR